MEEKPDKGFTVKDKRIFSEDGQTKEAEHNAKRQEDPAAATGQAQAGESTGKTTAEQPSPPLPEITFSSFILSLSSSALFHFGEIPDPVTNQKQRNLPLAKQTIDILGMMKEKTEGNLTKDERALLENLLYDLRMRYVSESQTPEKS